ncbi:hypothetical protein EDD80_12417 [Anseongella ginsenosidimutans]|uniref:Uncharacterized protein n=1 Tax=Anseongella ginsenosidimutans TaxID=496056 RepID=A0A4R3KKG5_9SPHI|nr:hypothetical protein [Anseongella ginsenosidimutans]QEC53615.1 hypothetical protein FRZ59_15580 [Anseongella ginsenosidimutans]TCS83960.1 hypothetical protein EDD80_12417 [Anseongella ginsenosidimutans]
MAKLTDQTILQHYQEKKQGLTQELQKVEAILTALNSHGDIADVPRKRKYTRRAPFNKSIGITKGKNTQPSNTAKAETTTAKNPRSAKAAKKAPSTSSSLTEPNQKGSWDQKIQTALSNLGSGTKESITQFITKRDPATSAEKVRKALTLRLAILEKDGKLKKEQTGDQPQYRLG